MGRQLEPDEENDFLGIIDPSDQGRVTKENFLT